MRWAVFVTLAVYLYNYVNTFNLFMDFKIGKKVLERVNILTINVNIPVALYNLTQSNGKHRVNPLLPSFPRLYRGMYKVDEGTKVEF
jgi:hypothetical protein